MNPVAGTLELSAVEAFFTPVVLALPRLTAVFAVVPFLSGKIINGLTRSSLLMTLAIFFSPVIGDIPPSMGLHTLAIIAAKEAMIGTLIGLGFGIFIWAIQSAGDLIDFQTGAGNANFFDPAGGHDGGPTGNLLGWLVITLFVSAGGLLVFFNVLVDSYRIWPVASFFPNVGAVLEQFAIRQGDTLFQWIVKLASPVIFVLILVDLGMGLVGRVAPQLNVFVFAQPLKSLLATLMMLLFLFFLYDSLQFFLQPDNGVLNFLRNTL